MTDIRPKADEISRRIVARAHEYPQGNDQGSHAHRKAQLAGPNCGTFTVTTSRATWVVPTGWAIWIPSMVEHNLTAMQELDLFSLYFEPEDVRGLADYPCTVTVPQLLDQMIHHARTLPELYEVSGPEARFMEVLLDQILELPSTPIEVVVPEPGQLRRIYDVLIEDPLDPRSLEDWAAELHMSRRTLTRLFTRTVGVGFKTWRTQLKLVKALEALSAGQSVSSIALDLGYSSASGFATVFKKYLGTAPTKYFH